jgi:hypothetical protein
VTPSDDDVVAAGRLARVPWASHAARPLRLARKYARRTYGRR